MSRSGPVPGDAVGVDPAAVVSDDHLLDLLGGGLGSRDLAEGTDPAAALLREFRLAIDDVTVARTLRRRRPLPLAGRRRGRTRSRVAVASLAAAGLLSVSGVAAAVPAGPLHRALFGPATTQHRPTADKALLQQVRSWLGAASAQLQAARRSGYLSVAARAGVSALLDRAGAALGRVPDGSVRDALATRLTALRRELAALPAVGPSRGATGTQARTGPTSGSSAQPSQSTAGTGGEPGATPEPTDSEVPQPPTTDEPGTASSTDPTSSSETDTGTVSDGPTSSAAVPQDVVDGGTSAEG